MEMKIATFNLKHDFIPFTKNHWCNRKDAVKAFFSAEKPDIVGTQELTEKTLKDMEDIAEGYCWVGEGRGGGKQGEYTAIFYRADQVECLDSGTFWLAREKDVPNKRDWFAMFPRICTWALFQGAGGAKIRVYNTHLDHISPMAKRNGILLTAQQAKEQHEKDGVPTVITGDFNATPGSPAMKALQMLNQSHGLFSGNSYNFYFNAENRIIQEEKKREFRGRTYHGFNGRTTGLPIDYILTSKEVAVSEARIVQCKYCGKYPSDHFPVIMEVGLPDQQ